MLEPRRHVDFADLDDDLAAELGRLSVHVARAIEALPHVARAHVYRIGDGGEHLHIWFFARPAEQLQLRGSYLVSWDDILPAAARGGPPGRRGRGGPRAGRVLRRIGPA